MPIYEYEPTEHDCLICSGRFEVLQRMDESAFEHCPVCGMPVIRVISQLASKQYGTSLHDRAARKGLTTFRRTEKGKWEKIAGEGVDMIVGSEEDMRKIEAEKRKTVNLDDAD